MNQDAGRVIVEGPGPAGLEAALRKFKKATIPVLSEWKRRRYALGPSAKRREKAQRARARLVKNVRRRAAARGPDDD